MTVKDPQLNTRPLSDAIARPRSVRRSAGLAPFFAVAIFALALISQNLILAAGVAVFATFVVRASHLAPACSFAVFYCVLYISVGAAFFGQVGRFPGDVASNAHVYDAVYVLLAGYAAIFAGYLIATGAKAQPPLGFPAQFSSIKRDHLAILCLLLFAPDWFGFTVSGNADLSGWAQVTRHAWDFRLVVLSYFILRAFDFDDLRSLSLIAFVTIYVGLPMSTDGTRGWSSMIVLGAMLASYAFIAQNRSALSYLGRRPLMTAAGAAAIAALLGMALLWEGGLKGEWRQAMRESEAGATIADQLSNLVSRAQASARTTDYTLATEGLSARLSSGVGYFSLVLSNLEQGMPHASGEQTISALQNVPPRLLFPDKRQFGSDSEIVERYAGIDVAGAEQETSIGLGFIAELYIDFGLAGALVGCLVLGAMLGASHRILRWAAGNDMGGDLAFLVLIFIHFLVYDASLAKVGAAIIHKTIVFAALLYALRMVFPARPQRHDV